MCGLFCLLFFSASAQCPDNIDFERGDFTGWKAWVGWHYLKANGIEDTVDVGVQVPPQPTRHLMLSSFPGDGKDPYGGFSRNCPNGSGHSIRLGLDSIGNHISMAQGLSYDFTIPQGQKNFNLVYNYALVLQNSGASMHTPHQEACFVIEVQNLTDNVLLGCTSFNFHATSGIPGFYPSTEDTAVKCKDWAQGFMNLENLEGKNIRLFFKTATCTVYGHWGYAYIDVNTACSSAFTGATYCKDDTAVVLTAPSGYANYHWYNLSNPNLGNQQTITIKPPPPSGDSVFVDINPYKGYGCIGTLKAYLFDTLTLKAFAGPDHSTCYGTPNQLGAPPRPDLKYKWSPANGLNNPDIANPIAIPDTSTQYILTVTSKSGGCAVTDTVTINVEVLSDSIQLIGDSNICIGSGKSAALKVLPADSIQWYMNGVAIPGATQTLLNITQTGAYYATKFSNTGCTRNTPIKQINIDETPVAAFSINKSAQCFAGNNFIFTNSSTISTGALDYSWNMGNGTTFTTDNVIYSYPIPGNYMVTLTAATPGGGCKKDSVFNVVVYPKIMAAFAIDKDVQCFKNNTFNFTNQSIASDTPQYIWSLGDGTLLQTKDVRYSYAQAGSFLVKLTATGLGSCSNDSAVRVTVNPSPAIGFAVNNAAQCFPGHQFIITNGTTVLTGALKYVWSLGDGTIKDSTDIVYSYAKPGAYTIKLLANTDIGCADSLQKDVNVYATPTADFTIRPVCENVQVPVINRTLNNTNSTVNYLWDFDNGHTDNAKNPIYDYPAAGSYSVKLTVSTAQCPVSFDTKTVDIIIDKPIPGISYPDKDAAFNFPEQLQARVFGTSVTWSPATNLNNRFSYTPTFTGLSLQLYTVQIKTATGCITVDTQLVKTHKKIEIYVPNAFTPDGNGTNERLRPVLIGFAKVNYFNIYNRYGQLLFTMNSDQPGWDGKIKGKLADTQTVVWMIEAIDVDGVVHTKKGTTVLYR